MGFSSGGQTSGLAPFFLYHGTIFFNSFIELKFTSRKVHPLKMYRSQFLVYLPEFCNHHHILFLEHCHHRQRRPIPISSHCPPCPSPNKQRPAFRLCRAACSRPCTWMELCLMRALGTGSSPSARCRQGSFRGALAAYQTQWRKPTAFLYRTGKGLKVPGVKKTNNNDSINNKND